MANRVHGLDRRSLERRPALAATAMLAAALALNVATAVLTLLAA